MPSQWFLMVVSLMSVFISGCATMSQTTSLYQRIGGQEMLYTISSQTLDRLAEDPRTKRSFQDVKMSTLKQSFTDFLCVKTGGQCVYEGETMKNSHADLHITTAEYELTVQSLRDVLDANHIATKEKNELLKILAPMKREIVSP
jgi:hemoglobin